MNGIVRDVFVVDKNITAISGHQADDHIKTGRFTGAIGTKQTDDFTAFYRQ